MGRSVPTRLFLQLNECKVIIPELAGQLLLKPTTDNPITGLVNLDNNYRLEF